MALSGVVVTCIAAVVEGERIFMGGDSAVSSDTDLAVRADPKVFRNGPMLIGCAGSVRVSQLLRYALAPPKHPRRTDVHRYMVTDFVDAVRECLKKGGVAHKQNDVEAVEGIFIVGYDGRLFTIDGDYQVGECADGFLAVGSGARVASGALYVTKGVSARTRIRNALEAAERFTPSVRRPFYVQSIEP